MAGDADHGGNLRTVADFVQQNVRNELSRCGADAAAGIGPDRHDEVRLRFDAPHHVDQIAGIGGAQLQTELAAQLARAEPHRTSSPVEPRYVKSISATGWVNALK